MMRTSSGDRNWIGMIVWSLAMLLSTALVSIVVTSPGAKAQGLENVFFIKFYGALVVGTRGGGDPDGYGSGTVVIDYEMNSLHFHLIFHNIDEPEFIYLEQGDIATSGSGACLRGNLLERRYSVVRTRGASHFTFDFKGSIPLDIALLDRISSNPSNYFILVNNRQFRAGALRAPLQTGLQAGSYGGVTVIKSDAAMEYSP